MAGLGFLVQMTLVVALVAIWLYGLLHPLFNHGRAGTSLLVLFVPRVAMLYVIFHRCPDRVGAASSG